MNALRPGGPYPILVLEGPAASGKSSWPARCDFATHRPRSSACPTATKNCPPTLSKLDSRLRRRVPFFAENRRRPVRRCLRRSHPHSQPDLRDALEIEVARPIILAAPHDDGQIGGTSPRALSHRTVTLGRPQIRRPQPERAIWSEFESVRSAGTHRARALRCHRPPADSRHRSCERPALSRRSLLVRRRRARARFH